jgi:uncharacterized protein
MAHPRRNLLQKNDRKSNTLFADTNFWVGLFTVRDQHHAVALKWKVWIDNQFALLLTTEAVLWEVLNTMSNPAARARAVGVYRQCHDSNGVEVVPFETAGIESAVAMYSDRADKSWSMTDCYSFFVMRHYGVLDALTADRDFKQAGFRALLLEDPPP